MGRVVLALVVVGLLVPEGAGAQTAAPGCEREPPAAASPTPCHCIAYYCGAPPSGPCRRYGPVYYVQDVTA